MKLACHDHYYSTKAKVNDTSEYNINRCRYGEKLSQEFGTGS
ncbi:hypothetical protein TOT_010000459 [Theileria orientalis strain Shintoku]|uniref:Uncharacterized protein n=1 Tax=Theileria orientalis strain Shintoku TaxID=869250 RepID=J4DNI0_THEOR|nr:hypothetical protein TOT_010000459 [Theileria orientalis strain Shintoku]BAM38994.1 hypothetical protein TOT_010000459 [Theileria orientalis strain Shintoku]|eukprot:XP_009689295.1 hypothetical protein TOT_010000459 [Theileria orientalis strain Shintoku]